MSFDWKNLVKSIAPMLGTALGGPLGGLAGAALGKALGATETDDKALAAAIQGATPDQLMAIQKAESEFKLQMVELGFKNTTDLEKIAAEDRASARDREKTVRDKMPMILGIGVATGFFALLFYMLKFDIPPANKDVLNILLGALGSSFISIISYYFGSSAGSARKDEMSISKK